MSIEENQHFTMDFAGPHTLSLGSRTLLMGILNVTPDSFSDGGKYVDPEKAIARALQMAEEGADIIDIGGVSSRPGAELASEAEELRRVMPVVRALANEGLILSVDTFRARVADEVLAAGAHIINDIGTMMLDPDLIEVVSRWQAPYVLMHNHLQIKADVKYQNLIEDIKRELVEAMDKAVGAGLPLNRIIIDPGIGFGKSPAQNRLIIKRLADFQTLGRPILVGASRKSFIGHTLDLDVEERVEGSLAVAALAVVNGAHILRVHDVKASKRVVLMTEAVMNEDG